MVPIYILYTTNLVSIVPINYSLQEQNKFVINLMCLDSKIIIEVLVHQNASVILCGINKKY